MIRISNEELRRVVAEASPGPWELRDAESYNGRSTTYYVDVWDSDLNVIASEAHRAHGDGGRSNMRLIALAPQLAAEVLQLREENAELKTSVVAFCAPHAVNYAQTFGLPEGHLHPTHYDILERAGGRMDNFTRAALSPAPVVDAVKQGDAQ